MKDGICPRNGPPDGERIGHIREQQLDVTPNLGVEVRHRAGIGASVVADHGSNDRASAHKGLDEM